MKANPANMREAFDAVVDYEKICAEPKKGVSILAVRTEDAESDAEDDVTSETENAENEEDAMDKADKIDGGEWTELHEGSWDWNPIRAEEVKE